MDTEDIAAIDTWLSTAPSFERFEDDHKIVWKRYRDGLLQKVEYDPESHNIVAVSVLTTESATQATADLPELQRRFVQYMLQPTGTQISEQSLAGNASRTYWGGERYLSTHTLHTDLLDTIIDELTRCIKGVVRSYDAKET